MLCLLHIYISIFILLDQIISPFVLTFKILFSFYGIKNVLYFSSHKHNYN